MFLTNIIYCWWLTGYQDQSHQCPKHSTLCLAPWLNWLIIDFKVESFDFHTGSERLKSEISTFHTHTHKTQPNNQCFGTTTTVYQPQWSNAETIPNPIKGVHHCTSFCSEELPAASSLCNRNPSIWFLDSYVPPVQICQKKFMDCEFLRDERKWFCRPWKSMWLLLLVLHPVKQYATTGAGSVAY